MAKIKRNDPCPCGSGKKYKYCCYQKDYRQVQPQKIMAEFSLDDGLKAKMPIASLDSIPMHNANGLLPDITPEQMMGLCLDEIYKILQQEKVGMMRDLVDQVIREMDIIPTFTYRQIGERISQDVRFEHHLMQVCSLKGTDPIELLMKKLNYE